LIFFFFSEGSVFAPNARSSQDFGQWIQDNYPGISEKEVSQMLNKYPLMEALPNHDSWFPSASQAYGEATFICPTNAIPIEYTRRNLTGQTWSYRFNVYDEDNARGGFGVPHVMDAPAVFGAGYCPTNPSYFTYNQPIIPVMMSYFISFVRDLNPNTYKHPSAPDWKNWGEDQERLVLETGNTHMESTPREQRERCEFWKSIAKDTRQ
jgi:acetylcholinesterase